MTTIEDRLVQIEHLIAKGSAREPEALLRQLVSEMGKSELTDWRVDLQRIIDRFQPKRRGELVNMLRAALEAVHTPPIRLPSPQSPQTDLEEVERSLRAGLSDLSQKRIFQWSTFYRDFLTDQFALLLSAAPGSDLGEIARLARRSLAEHSAEIFSKGYAHVRRQLLLSQYDALQKALSGLGKFLDIVIELYSSHSSSSSPGTPDYRDVRAVTSALLSGILEGFASCQLGPDTGASVLPRFPRAWAHYYAFLTHEAATEITAHLEPDDFTGGITTVVLPTLGALQTLLTRSDDLAPVPILGQFLWEERRLDIVLRPGLEAGGVGLLEINCFLNETLTSVHLLQNAAKRGAHIVVASLKPDVGGFAQSQPQLEGLIVDVRALDHPEEAGKRILIRLDDELYRRSSPRLAGRPLSYNLARDFPLRNPFKTRYYHVPRTSVRDLLRAFERRNGVRLWCSVRRSGKTTACFDLGSTTGSSVVVSQTCDSTEQVPNAHLFYDLVLQALEAGRQLQSTFVEEAVARCEPPHAADVARRVFVIDEYETLFGRLRGSVRKDIDLRYTVVQPLLNQLVGFTRDNLLVFMGQHPNAHHVLMDQNQLSAYVEQDSFPLFQHTAGTASGEFAELVRKILTDRIEFDAGFADMVHMETAGHPFLTANLLVEIVEWLIATARPAKGLRLRRDDFQMFANERLTPEHIRLAQEYDFFRGAVSEATSLDGAAFNPWLHSIYGILHVVGQGISRADFVQACQSLRITDLGFEPDEILRSGAQSNFFEYDDLSVRPKVRLLGRIAAVTRPRIAA